MFMPRITFLYVLQYTNLALLDCRIMVDLHLSGLQIELDRHGSQQELVQVNAASLIAVCNMPTADEIRHNVSSLDERYQILKNILIEIA